MKLLRKPLAAAVAALFLTLPALAQTTATHTPAAQVATTTQGIVVPRIQGVIENAARATLSGSHTPLAAPGNDLGAVDPAMPLHGISLIFSRSAQQEAALQALLVAQQNPASPQYHQWLTPDQYAAQFGVADSDIAAASSWLQQQGFSIDSVSRSHNRIAFSGTAAQAAAAFGAPIHNYRSPDGSTHFAPSTDLTIPAALSSVVLGVANLSSFRPHPMIKPITHPADPQFTSSISGNHFIGPGDLTTLYDVKPVYQAGYNGINQSIAVIGQSSVYLSDIAAFQTAAGVTAKTPVTVLLPGSGSATTPVSGDESESDLDLEYTSTMAPGAQVFFIYTGANTNYGAFDSLIYAVEERIAPIISSSYGACEQALGTSNLQLLDSYFVQATAEGQTIVSAAGDQGSSGCYGEYSSTDLADNLQLAIIYPAGSANVTAMGGTEIPTASAAASNSTYWTAANGSDVIASIKSYIPEQVWNDSVAAGGPDGGGGGASIYEARPSWQTGISIGGVAIPSGSFRLVPDISMVASNYNAPLLYCTSDTSSWGSGQAHSCNSGFRDSSTNDLTVAGGTSFDAPIFSGMLALINQALNSTGQGNVNPTLYSLASNTTTYASAFHDITVAGNQCLAGAAVCGTGAAVTNFASTTGYDEASGLGSIDLNNLLTAWAKISTGASLSESITSVTAATTTPVAGATDTVTVAITPVSGTGVPTGTVTLLIDGGTANGGSSTTLTLTNGSATYSFSSTVSGAHILVATYNGSSTFGPSAGTLAVNVSTGSTASVTTLSAATTTPAAGAIDNITITVTPGSGTTVPTGSVSVSVDSIFVGNLALTNGVAIYAFSSTVTGTHIISASYNGNSTFASSSGNIAVSVAGGTTAGTFTLTATPSSLSVADGASGSFNLTITPVSGYTGTVYLESFNVTPSSLNNFCFADNKNYTLPITVSSGAVSDTITFYTNANTCSSLGLTIYTAKGGSIPLRATGANHAQSTTPTAPTSTPVRRTALASAMVCLLLTFSFGSRSRRLRSNLVRGGLSLTALALLSLAGFGLTACSNSSAPSAIVQQASYTTPGTYIFTFVAQDSVNANLTAQGSVTLTVQ